MGAAGFGKEDVEIEVKENTLSIRVRRRKKTDAERRFLYRGIRAFERPSNLPTKWK